MSAGICGIVTGEVQDSTAREATGNELVMLMHLLKEVKGPGQLINLLKNTGVTDSLSFLKSYREELEVKITSRSTLALSSLSYIVLLSLCI